VIGRTNGGQTADHRPDGHAQHVGDEPEQLTEHGQALVVVDVVRRERPRSTLDVAALSRASRPVPEERR
jgi:hypothetical protein